MGENELCHYGNNVLCISNNLLIKGLTLLITLIISNG